MAKQVETRRAANGEGSVRFNTERERYEGRTTVRLDADGKPVRRMVTGRSEREVRKRVRDLMAATDNGLTPAARSLTVGRFLDDWINDVLPGTVAPPTRSSAISCGSAPSSIVVMVKTRFDAPACA